MYVPVFYWKRDRGEEESFSGLMGHYGLWMFDPNPSLELYLKTCWKLRKFSGEPRNNLWQTKRQGALRLLLFCLHLLNCDSYFLKVKPFSMNLWHHHLLGGCSSTAGFCVASHPGYLQSPKSPLLIFSLFCSSVFLYTCILLHVYNPRWLWVVCFLFEALFSSMKNKKWQDTKQ